MSRAKNPSFPAVENVGVGEWVGIGEGVLRVIGVSRGGWVGDGVIWFGDGMEHADRRQTKISRMELFLNRIKVL